MFNKRSYLFRTRRCRGKRQQRKGEVKYSACVYAAFKIAWNAVMVSRAKPKWLEKDMVRMLQRFGCTY